MKTKKEKLQEIEKLKANMISKMNHEKLKGGLGAGHLIAGCCTQGCCEEQLDSFAK